MITKSRLRISAAAIFAAAGVAALWHCDVLLLWLTHVVGPEYALGEDNVVYLENGGVLLTNPVAMLLWSVPIWATAGGLLVTWHVKRTRIHPEQAMQQRRIV